MAEKAKYYDLEAFNTWKGQRRVNFTPPRPNFIAAASYIRKFFDAKGFEWAAIGGLAMLCIGSRREMVDIHVVYDDRDFQQIKIKWEADRRYLCAYPVDALLRLTSAEQNCRRE